MAVQNGQKAPAFTLPDAEKKERSLAEFLGRKTVLAFYPGAFTGVCTREMCALRDSMAKFNDLNAQVVGISVDAPFANKAFAAANSLQFPLLSDYTRAVSRQYCGVHDDFSGLKGYAASKRSIFVLDPSGTVRYMWVSEMPGIEPPYEDINKALAAIPS